MSFTAFVASAVRMTSPSIDARLFERDCEIESLDISQLSKGVYPNCFDSISLIETDRARDSSDDHRNAKTSSFALMTAIEKEAVDFRILSATAIAMNVERV